MKLDGKTLVTAFERMSTIRSFEERLHEIALKDNPFGFVHLYAGAEATASAVIADMVDVTRMHTADPEHHVPHFAFRSDRLSDTPVLPMGEVKSCYYLRMQVVDQPGVLADITRILGDLTISIEAMLQREPVEGEAFVNIIIITHITREKNMNAAIDRIEALPVTTGSVIRIRIESLDGK